MMRTYEKQHQLYKDAVNAQKERIRELLNYTLTIDEMLSSIYCDQYFRFIGANVKSEVYSNTTQALIRRCEKDGMILRQTKKGDSGCVCFVFPKTKLKTLINEVKKELSC